MKKFFLILPIVGLLGIAVYYFFKKPNGDYFKGQDTVFYLDGDRLFKYFPARKTEPIVVYDVRKDPELSKWSLTCNLCKFKQNEILAMVSKHITNTSDNEQRLLLINVDSGKIEELCRLGPDQVINSIKNPTIVKKSLPANISRLAVSADGRKIAGLVEGHKIVVLTFDGRTIQDNYFGFDGDEFVICPPIPDSFSPDGRYLYLSGISQKTGCSIYELDLEKEYMKLWKNDLGGYCSPDGRRFASIEQRQDSKDNSDLIVMEGGQTILRIPIDSLTGINHWIDNSRILFKSEKYFGNEDLGVVDLDKKKVIKIDIPIKGGICGACFFPAPAYSGLRQTTGKN